MSRFGVSPRTPALRSGCSGARLFGGRKESFPQLRSPPRSGLLEYSALPFVLWSFRVFWLRLACLRSPPSHNPLPRFQNNFHGVASATKLLHCKITAALIQGRGRPSGNVRGAKPNVLAPPALCAHIPPVKDKRNRGRGSLEN